MGMSKTSRLPADPRMVYRFAREFTNANAILVSQWEKQRREGMKRAEEDHPFLAVFSMNEAFSYELMLKCLYCLESNSTDVPEGHDLCKLFYLLSQPLQQRIKDVHKHLIENDINCVVDRLQSPNPESFEFMAQIK